MRIGLVEGERQDKSGGLGWRIPVGESETSYDPLLGSSEWSKAIESVIQGQAVCGCIIPWFGLRPERRGWSANWTC